MFREESRAIGSGFVHPVSRERLSIMRSHRSILGLALLLALSATGCRCFPGFNKYCDFIDDQHDVQVVWDAWYNPRFDISRAGRPDWCGPVNRRLGPCRCDQVGTWKRANDCWLYPSGYPYSYPDQALHRVNSSTEANPVAPAAEPSDYEAAPETSLPTAPEPTAPAPIPSALEPAPLP